MSHLKSRSGGPAVRAVLLLAVIVGLVLPADAAGYVYWANNAIGSFQGTTIGEGGLSGGPGDAFFITGASAPCGVAVDSQHVYWANNAGNTIGRASLNGTGKNQSFITGANDSCGVAVDAAHVYWARLGNNTIGRANLDGTNKNQSFITGANEPCGVAVGTAHLFWDNGGTNTIGRATLAGTSPNQSFITGAKDPCGVAVDGGHIYWANHGTIASPGATIGRASLNGTGKNQSFITEATAPCGVATDALPDASTTAVACSPATVEVMQPTTCTATITDGAASPHAPTGTVVFGTASGGAFTPAANCSLTATGANASSCQLTYTPSVVGTITITGAYGGDFAHELSSVNTTITSVAKPPPPPSNDFTLGKPKLNKRKGTATIAATVPGPGNLLLSGKGLRKRTKTAKGAGRVKLTVKGTSKTVKKLKRKGKARVKAKVTYTPTDGTANTESKKLTLKLKR